MVIKIPDLDVYKLARELSKIGWEIYKNLDWKTQKILGDQFIESTDSVGANIAESYGRFHFLDKNKFLYNARGSLSEASMYWVELLHEREKINDQYYSRYKSTAQQVGIKLNNLISVTKKSHQNEHQKQITN